MGQLTKKIRKEQNLPCDIMHLSVVYYRVPNLCIYRSLVSPDTCDFTSRPNFLFGITVVTNKEHYIEIHCIYSCYNLEYNNRRHVDAIVDRFSKVFFALKNDQVTSGVSLLCPQIVSCRGSIRLLRVFQAQVVIWTSITCQRYFQ